MQTILSSWFLQQLLVETDKGDDTLPFSMPPKWGVKAGFVKKKMNHIHCRGTVREMKKGDTRSIQ